MVTCLHTVSGSLFVDNIIAVKEISSALTNSDLFFDLELTGTRTAGRGEYISTSVKTASAPVAVQRKVVQPDAGHGRTLPMANPIRLTGSML